MEKRRSPGIYERRDRPSATIFKNDMSDFAGHEFMADALHADVQLEVEVGFNNFRDNVRLRERIADLSAQHHPLQHPARGLHTGLRAALFVRLEHEVNPVEPLRCLNHHHCKQ